MLCTGEDSMNLVESHSRKAEKSEQSLLLCIARENSFEFESRQVRRLGKHFRLSVKSLEWLCIRRDHAQD